MSSMFDFIIVNFLLAGLRCLKWDIKYAAPILEDDGFKVPFVMSGTYKTPAETWDEDRSGNVRAYLTKRGWELAILQDNFQYHVGPYEAEKLQEQCSKVLDKLLQ